VTKTCGSEFGGLLWRQLTPRRKMAMWYTTTVPQVQNRSKDIFGKFTSCMTFGGAQTCSFRTVFGLHIRTLTLAVRKFFLYRCTSAFSALNYCSAIFSNPSDIYTKWCAQSFPMIFGLFANFDRHFSEFVRQLATKMRIMYCLWKADAFWKNGENRIKIYS